MTGSILKVRDENGNFIDIPAIKGDEGKSAYEHALDGGFIGTEEEFNKAIADLSPSVTPEMIGAADAEHKHSTSDITSGVLGVARGGTGASGRTGAFNNLAYLGEDVISSTTEDMPANWVALGTGYAYFKTKNLLTDQPFTWGIVINIIKGTDIFQTWYSIGAAALMCKRAGNTGNGWYSSWVKMLDENGGTITGNLSLTNDKSGYASFARDNTTTVILANDGEKQSTFCLSPSSKEGALALWHEGTGYTIYGEHNQPRHSLNATETTPTANDEICWTYGK